MLSLYVDDVILPVLPQICENAFKHFNHPKVVPVVPVGPINILEAFHGNTLAFKDIGLSILAQMMEHLLQKKNEKRDPKLPPIRANVLCETSGDTGPGKNKNTRPPFFFLLSALSKKTNSGMLGRNAKHSLCAYILHIPSITSDPYAS